jgi:diguanylate cyclase (GGDEF)-like protein
VQVSFAAEDGICREVEDMEHEKIKDPKALQAWLGETGSFIRKLSKGEFPEEEVSEDNPLREELINLDSNLRQMAALAARISAGDYTKKAREWGELGETFNTMISRIDEREARLQEEKKEARLQAETASSCNEFLAELTRRQKEWILVVDADSKDIVYCNRRRQGHEEEGDQSFCEICENRLPFRSRILNWEDTGQSSKWEADDGECHYYSINTFPFKWDNRNVNAHILLDITDEKLRTSALKNKAYRDALTGVYNRVYFEEYMDKVLRKKERAILGYLDLDCLKHVNDQYGHAAGDSYIRKFVFTIRQNFRTTDIFARVGGDEFCLILSDIEEDVVVEKLQTAMEEFQCCEGGCIQGFSYGVVSLQGKEETRTLKEIINTADSAMYECKRKNKELYRQWQEEGRHEDSGDQ